MVSTRSTNNPTYVSYNYESDDDFEEMEVIGGELSEELRIPSGAPANTVNKHPAALRTERLRRQNKTALLPRIKKVFEVLKEQDLNLMIVLDAISWGDNAAALDYDVQNERESILRDHRLADILERWRNPPQRRSEGASKALNAFALTTVRNGICRDFKTVRSHFEVSPEVSDMGSLLSMDFGVIIKDLQATPFLWPLFSTLAQTARQVKENTKKEPSHTILLVTSLLLYSRTNRISRFQKFFSFYFKYLGLPAKSIDTLHDFGFVMSARWLTDAVNAISEAEVEEARAVVATSNFLGNHDNICLTHRVNHQRLDKKTGHEAGTTMAIYKVPGSMSSSDYQALQVQRRKGVLAPLSPYTLVAPNKVRDTRLRLDLINNITTLFLGNPTFATYKHRGHANFARPPPIHLVPQGKSAIKRTFLLGTFRIDESSYDGTDKVVDQVWKVVGLKSTEGEKELSTRRIVPWSGDLLTVSLMRNLQRARADDLNGFDRMDWLDPIMGWFHSEMNHANGIHKQLFSSPRNFGLAHAASLLGRTGLQRVATSGPFYYQLDELLWHFAEARVRAAFLTESGCSSLEDLLASPIAEDPAELGALAERVYDNYFSRAAIARHNALPLDKQDRVFWQTIVANVEVIRYIEMDSAIKAGDIGRMDNLVPHLLFRAAGGGQKNYFAEYCELEQSKLEIPDAQRLFVRENSWVMTNTGKPDSFLPIDLNMEHYIRDIKRLDTAVGAADSWAFLRKITPAIPSLAKLADHVETLLQNTRGSKHVVSDAESDIRKLCNAYLEAEIFQIQPGREAKVDDIKDITSAGIERILSTDLIAKWAAKRTRPRTAQEVWGLNDAEEDGDHPTSSLRSDSPPSLNDMDVESEDDSSSRFSFPFSWSPTPPPCSPDTDVAMADSSDDS